MRRKKLMMMELELKQAILAVRRNKDDYSNMETLNGILEQYADALEHTTRFAAGNTVMGGILLSMYVSNGMCLNSQLLSLLSELILKPTSYSDYKYMPLYLFLLFPFCFTNALVDRLDRKILEKTLQQNDIQMIFDEESFILRLKE